MAATIEERDSSNWGGRVAAATREVDSSKKGCGLVGPIFNIFITKNHYLAITYLYLF